MIPANFLLHELGNASGRSGTLVRGGDNGSHVGAILVESGRVCWARSAAQRGRMVDLLLSHSDMRLSRDALEVIVRDCQSKQLPLGEELVRRNFVTQEALRSALLRHTCEAVRDIVATTHASWRWVAHRGGVSGYSRDLTFSPAEVFAGVHAIREPGVVDMLERNLARGIRSNQHGFVFSDSSQDMTPYAQVDWEGDLPQTLFELAPHARELASLGSFADAKGIVVDAENFAFLVWEHAGFLYVVLDAKALGFNRLVSQLATLDS